MKLIRSLFLSSLLLTVIFITGCNEGPTTSVDPINTGVQLSKFSLPAGETLTSATLHIYVNTENNLEVDIYQVDKDWDEMAVTWNNKPITSATAFSFTSGPVGWVTVDITALVQKWLDGTIPNYGLLLDQIDVVRSAALYDSREGTNKPFIRVVHSGGTVDVEDIADSYIWENKPTNNYGDDLDLYTGYINGTTGYEKQSLLKFDIEYVPEVSCETAFAYDETDGTCFLDLGFNRWGWSIKLSEPGTYTFPVYAAAGQCDLSKGTYVGDVTVEYADGTVKFEYDFEEGFSASEEHFYAGYNQVASDKKGKPTVAPGQYKIGTGLSGPIYIIAHAVVCSSDWD